MSSVKLKDVTAKNWRAIARLALAPGQEDLVADNLYSIAEVEVRSRRTPARGLCG